MSGSLFEASQGGLKHLREVKRTNNIQSTLQTNDGNWYFSSINTNWHPNNTHKKPVPKAVMGFSNAETKLFI